MAEMADSAHILDTPESPWTGKRVGLFVVAALWALATTAVIVILAGPLVLASAGIGPASGTVSVSSCFVASTADGYIDGHECQGSFTRRGEQTPGEMVTFRSRGLHESGKIDVRFAVNHYTQAYVGGVLNFVWWCLLLAAMGWPPLAWLIVRGRRDYSTSDDLVFGQLGLIFIVLVLGLPMTFFA
ncbi:hypothetical protein [Kineosporia sp. NBRC 101731]|uniref:hypothetical protein n=1 Tax=Kineosporia sp. NBRC 101731 TaxID=3032199 RepID=UPI0025564F8A|nr:hypothetical protein [Kineosporia sp. NBRC 101731]